MTKMKRGNLQWFGINHLAKKIWWRKEGVVAWPRAEVRFRARDAMPSAEGLDIYASPFPLFAKLTKLQSPIAKPLNMYFLHIFVNTCMQSLFAKRLGMLLVMQLSSGVRACVLRPCLDVKFFEFHYCSTFVCLWQILSNHSVDAKLICKHKGLIPDSNVKACQPIWPCYRQRW